MKPFALYGILAPFLHHLMTIEKYCVKGSLITAHDLCPEVIKNISCSIQLSMKFFLLINVKMPTINVKMPTIVGILTFMRKKNCILGLSEPEKKC